MPRLSLTALLKRLGERPPSAAIFLHGDDEYTREKTVQQIVDLLLEPATRDFNLDQVRGGDASPEGLGSLLATPPMMAEYRIIVVREAQSLSVKAREAVEEALRLASPGLVLVVVATIPSSSKAKFYETLRAEALSVEFGAVDPIDLPGWVIEHGSAVHGIEIDLEAARALSAAIGSNLGILATEIEKAAAYVGERKRVTREDVTAVGGYVPRVDRWGWFDKVGGRQFSVALGELPELLASGETAVGLVIGLGSHMLRVGILVAGGRDALERHLASNQRWLVNRLQPQARGWTLEQIDRALADLLRTDRLLKSASLTDRQAMEELLLRLALQSSEKMPGRGRRAAEAVA
jgi:DNA polymerase III subunit delta